MKRHRQLFKSPATERLADPGRCFERALRRWLPSTLYLGVALLVLALGWMSRAQAQTPAMPITVEVFANSAMHITPAGEARSELPYKIDVYYVDGLQMLEQSLNQELPQTEPEARQWLAENQARIQREVAPVAIAAANGMALAQHFKIKRLPAIVIDRKAVVYGLTDVTEAVERFIESQP